MTTLTAAEKYRQSLRVDDSEIVDVTVPSGNTFQFRKPSKFAVLFGIGNLPQSAASQAAEQWQKDGLITTAAAAETVDVEKQFKIALDMRDRVLKLSHSPKIVMGTANEAAGEISADDIDNTDLEYLFKWVAAGGDTSLMLNTFPEGSSAGSMASPNRKTRRSAAKHVSRHKG